MLTTIALVSHIHMLSQEVAEGHRSLWRSASYPGDIAGDQLERVISDISVAPTGITALSSYERY